MKKLNISILFLLALTLTGCEEYRRTRDNGMFNNAYWDILKLNDSTLLMVPRSMDTVPIITRITHDPDCPCREKGGVDD